MGRSSGTIFVADGDTASRRLTRAGLERAGYHVCEFRSGAEVVPAAADQRPALVLLELRLPDVTGYELCRELRDAHGDGLPIFILSHDRTEAIDRVAGLLIGADDYIVKPFEPDELVARVRRFVEPGVGTVNGRPPGASLTPREREILRLLAEGRVQKEIARELSISPKTVGTHIQRLLTKVGAHSRAQLVALAYLKQLL
jgi:two-component system nitrate/nitrite response regulator NarL